MVHALKVGLPVTNILIIQSIDHVLAHDEEGQLHLGILTDKWRHQVLVMNRCPAHPISDTLQSLLIKPYEMDFELGEKRRRVPDPR